jgi:hypothetical protein
LDHLIVDNHGECLEPSIIWFVLSIVTSHIQHQEYLS